MATLGARAARRAPAHVWHAPSRGRGWRITPAAGGRRGPRAWLGCCGCICVCARRPSVSVVLEQGEGDAEATMARIADDVEWITPGNSAISGTLHSKQEVGALWAKLAEKGFATAPQHWFSDEDRVVVLTQVTVGGEQAD